MKKLAILLALFLVLDGFIAYRVLFAPNVNTKKNITIKIPTGSSFEDVLKILREREVLNDEFTFQLVAKWKDYANKIKPGNYLLTKGMNNRQIVNMLRLGWQQPVKLVVYNIRTKEEFCGLVGRTIELDSNVLLAHITSQEFLSRYNTDTNKVISRFITDNYELYWNTSLENFLDKMEKAYLVFWNEERLAKSAALNMNPEKVTTLAAIVEREVIFDKEMTTVAGVYLNRIKIGMPLQADPTLVFALKDFSARRVTNYHKEYDSPFNTYMYAGLPPGPICMPRKKSIDAVLNAEDHEFLYFCANPDLSGYSIFSKSYDDQMKVAAQYRKKMNEMKIR
jgi:UPF0755 protein